MLRLVLITRDGRRVPSKMSHLTDAAAYYGICVRKDDKLEEGSFDALRKYLNLNE